MDDFENSEGTLPYMPPEVLLGVYKHTFAADMWAVAIIYGELLAAAPWCKAAGE